MVLVFDLGATNMRLALVRDGVLGEVVHLPTDRSKVGLEQFLDALGDAAAGQPIEAVIGGFAGQLEGEDGNVILATNLPEWLELPLLKQVQSRFDCPVYVTNDVEMGGLGEAYVGAGTTKGVMAYYTVSTGVNAVRIVNGVIDTTIGRYELGKQILDAGTDGPRSLEWFIGGDSLQKRLGLAPREVSDPDVWLGLEQKLAFSIYNTILYWNPDTIVFGGSMMRDVKLSGVRAVLETLPQMRARWPELKRARLGDEVGLHGAMAQAAALGYK